MFIFVLFKRHLTEKNGKLQLLVVFELRSRGNKASTMTTRLTPHNSSMYTSVFVNLSKLLLFLILMICHSKFTYLVESTNWRNQFRFWASRFKSTRFDGFPAADVSMYFWSWDWYQLSPNIVSIHQTKHGHFLNECRPSCCLLIVSF